jgi:hypothetical protein
MTTDERINKLAEAMENFERVTRQGFQTLAELHADTQQAMTKLANSMSALADHVADHDVRLDKLDGGK